jgi:hypothetical protein
MNRLVSEIPDGTVHKLFLDDAISICAKMGNIREMVLSCKSESENMLFKVGDAVTESWPAHAVWRLCVRFNGLGGGSRRRGRAHMNAASSRSSDISSCRWFGAPTLAR